jgi:hypothetical protein
MGNREIHTGFLARKPKGKRPHGKHRCKWEDNIKTDLKELGWKNGLDLSGSGWEKIAGSGEHGNEP